LIGGAARPAGKTAIALRPLLAPLLVAFNPVALMSMNPWPSMPRIFFM